MVFMSIVDLLSICRFEYKVYQQNQMSEFDEYLLVDSPDRQHHQKAAKKYVVIESDGEDQHSPRDRLSGTPLKTITSAHSNLLETGASRGRRVDGLGTISRHILQKQEERSKIEGLKGELLKIEEQCRALEQLIEKTIKQEAELQVKKYQLARNSKELPVKSAKRRPNYESQDKQNILTAKSSLHDTSKTIKTVKPRIR